MIKWLFRLVMLAVLGFGLLLGVVYPWSADDQTGYEIGRLSLFGPQSAYETAEVSLDPSEEEVRVVVEITTDGAPAAADATVLELTVTREGRTELFHSISLAGIEPRLVSPQSQERVYPVEAGTLYFIKTEPYLFSAVPTESETAIRSVDLILLGGFFAFDESVPPIGYGMIAFAFIALVFSFRRRRGNPNSQPPSPKWGRG